MTGLVDELLVKEARRKFEWKRIRWMQSDDELGHPAIGTIVEVKGKHPNVDLGFALVVNMDGVGLRKTSSSSCFAMILEGELIQAKKRRASRKQTNVVRDQSR